MSKMPKLNFFKKRPKTMIALCFLASPIVILACIYGVYIIGGITTGEKANREIRHWLGDQNAIVSKSISYVEGFWIDPSFYFRFNVDMATLEKFKKTKQLKQEKTEICERMFTTKWPFRWLWGPPKIDALGCWANYFKGNAYYFYKDNSSNFIYLYVQNT